MTSKDLPLVCVTSIELVLSVSALNICFNIPIQTNLKVQIVKSLSEEPSLYIPVTVFSYSSVQHQQLTFSNALLMSVRLT